LNLYDDLGSKFSFGQQIAGMWQVQVGKHISGARRKFSIRHLPSPHCPASLRGS
jgi:hypothetical protein